MDLKNYNITVGGTEKPAGKSNAAKGAAHDYASPNASDGKRNSASGYHQ